MKLTDKDMLDIVRRVILDGEWDDEAHYAKFMTLLGDAITECYGGATTYAQWDPGTEEAYCEFVWDSECPEDGGIYRKYDREEVFCSSSIEAAEVLYVNAYSPSVIDEIEGKLSCVMTGDGQVLVSLGVLEMAVLEDGNIDGLNEPALSIVKRVLQKQHEDDCDVLFYC